MNRLTPILTVCAEGIDRSVALAKILKVERNYGNVLNCGINVVTPKTFDMLGKWAREIYVVGEQELLDKIPLEFRGKTTFINIGIDIWDDPKNPELLELLRAEADRIGL